MYYKCLTAEGRGPYSNKKWHLPTLQPDGTYKPGRWMPRITNPLQKCNVGYHGCKRDQLLRWACAIIYELEYDGEIESDDEKCWGARARLVRPLFIDTWTEKNARLLACRIAEDVLPLFERGRPDDDRPRQAIHTARRYASGEATKEELAAAAAAARAAANAAAAAWAAPWAAPWAAAWAAADAAARAAANVAADAWAGAWAAPWAAADAAARAAANVAADAWAGAWAAPWAAADAAARAAANAAAWDKYNSWLLEVLEA